MTQRRQNRRLRQAATVASAVLLVGMLAAWAASYIRSLGAGLEFGFGPERAARTSLRVGAFAGGLSASYWFIDHAGGCTKHSRKRITYYANADDWREEFTPQEARDFLAYMWDKSCWEWSFARDAGGRRIRCGFEDNCPTVRAQVGCPFWAAAATSAIPLSLLWFSSRICAKRGSGYCGVCGYDLRGTPDRCPECGTAVVPSQSAK